MKESSDSQLAARWKKACEEASQRSKQLKSELQKTKTTLAHAENRIENLSRKIRELMIRGENVRIEQDRIRTSSWQAFGRSSAPNDREIAEQRRRVGYWLVLRGDGNARVCDHDDAARMRASGEGLRWMAVDSEAAPMPWPCLAAPEATLAGEVYRHLDELRSRLPGDAQMDLLVAEVNRLHDALNGRRSPPSQELIVRHVRSGGSWRVETASQIHRGIRHSDDVLVEFAVRWWAEGPDGSVCEWPG